MPLDIGNPLGLLQKHATRIPQQTDLAATPALRWFIGLQGGIRLHNLNGISKIHVTMKVPATGGIRYTLISAMELVVVGGIPLSPVLYMSTLPVLIAVATQSC